MEPMYLSIQPIATGNRIKKLLGENGYTVKDIQGAMGFENPQAIYKWLSGKSLPSIDNFIILSKLLHTSIEDILVIDGDVFIFPTPPPLITKLPTPCRHLHHVHISNDLTKAIMTFLD